MKRRYLKIHSLLGKTALLCAVMGLSSCHLFDQIEERAALVNRFENVALTLSVENRKLQAEINQLQFEVQSLKSKNHYLEIQLEKVKGEKRGAEGKGRSLASLPPLDVKNDLVQFEVYKWAPSQMLAIAQKEFEQKNFEKSAQFFHSFARNFPSHGSIDDQFLFQAGLSAFESGGHSKWALQYFNKLVEDYPASSFYRSAKLWLALANLKEGNEGHFFETVEEFRKKYRNTKEWKVLSHHYEKIVQKYKN